ncbi:MAG: hypothetical protein ACK5C0_11525 [Candidatus Kapaibacterium sp.]
MILLHAAILSEDKDKILSCPSYNPCNPVLTTTPIVAMTKPIVAMTKPIEAMTTPIDEHREPS